jgi:hypothetical protein
MRIRLREMRLRRRGTKGAAAGALVLISHLVWPCAGAAWNAAVLSGGNGGGRGEALPPARGAPWQPVPDAVLAGARGGFDGGGGGQVSHALLVSFSIERLLAVNGTPVAADRLALSAQGGSAVARHEAAALHAVQLGLGNEVLPSAGAAPMGALAAAVPALLLQNTENGHFIRAQTTINTTVNSLATLKELNFGDSLRQALATAAAPR